MLKTLMGYWRGQSIFVLGGGPSVADVDLSSLVNKRVIGVNNAYLFGPRICDVLFFGDSKWWDAHRQKLASSYPNMVLTSAPDCENQPKEPYHFVPRTPIGFHIDSLGWNGNSGASAINLALLMGMGTPAPDFRIYLIGFDMKLNASGKNNWHVNTLNEPQQFVCDRHAEAITAAAPMVKRYWPDARIVNLNMDSALDCFQKQPWQEVLRKDEEDEIKKKLECNDHGGTDFGVSHCWGNQVCP